MSVVHTKLQPSVPRPAPPRRRAALYVIVLAAATIVMIIGLAAIATTRIDRRAQHPANDFAIARAGARSAIELGFAVMLRKSDWRDTYKSGVPWYDNIAIGAARLSLTVTDPADNDFADDPAEPVVLVGTALAGSARYTLRCRAAAPTRPLAVLSACAHSGVGIKVNAAERVTAIGAPLSTNGDLRLDGTIIGNIEAASRSGGGTLVGVATVPASAKALPDPAVVARYQGRATTLNLASPVTKAVFAPGFCSHGPSNRDGVYYIAPTGADLVIKGVRVNGTLIVGVSPGKKVTLQEAVLIEGGRSDYPALIVDGAIVLDLDKKTGHLAESTYATNFNPPGVPYAGVADTDTIDVYPSELRGLVHIRGSATIKQQITLRGVLVVDGAIEFGDDATFEHDAGLAERPPDGYTELGPMQLKSGSYERVVE